MSNKRKIILPNWSLDKNTTINKELIDAYFENFQIGEFIINTNPNSDNTVSFLDENNEINELISGKKCLSLLLS